MRPVRSRTPRKLADAIRRVQAYVGGDGLVLASGPQPAAAPAAIAAQGSDVSVTGAQEEAPSDVPVTAFPPEAEAKSLSVSGQNLLKCSVATDIDDAPWVDKGKSFAEFTRRHHLEFGATSGLELSSEEMAASRTILSHEIRGWSPRDMYPDAELFTSFLEGNAVLERTYANFRTKCKQDFLSF